MMIAGYSFLYRSIYTHVNSGLLKDHVYSKDDDFWIWFAIFMQYCVRVQLQIMHFSISSSFELCKHPSQSNEEVERLSDMTASLVYMGL